MADFLGVGGIAVFIGGECGCCSEAISERGALGRRMPPSRGRSCGDWELGSRGMEKEETAGELKEDGGADPDEYVDTTRFWYPR